MASASAISRLFSGTSVNRRIFRAAALVTASGVLVKMVATFKEFTVAAAFGRTDAMDAFLTAFLIPNLLINLISESMNQALVPTLVRVREQEGQARAQQLLSRAMFWSCLLLVAVSLLMAALAHPAFPLLAARFPAAKLALARRMFYALLPVVVITGIASNCTAVLNTVDRFTLPALAPIATPIAILLGAWLLASRCGIWAMVYATLAGATAHMLCVTGMMRARGYGFSLAWPGRLAWNRLDAPTREVAGQYGPILLSGLVASGGLLVDQAMAATLMAGSVSALGYANRFISVILTLFAGAIATAVTPYFAQMVARQDWAGCRHSLNTWFRVTALVSVPIAVALVFGAHPLVRLAFERGAFHPADTDVVARVLAMYAIQIPFFIVSRVFYRYLVAIRRTDLILACGALNLALDIALNLVCMRRLGVAGIALATSLWTVSTFLFLWYWAYRLLPPQGAPRKVEVPR